MSPSPRTVYVVQVHDDGRNSGVLGVYDRVEAAMADYPLPPWRAYAENVWTNDRDLVISTHELLTKSGTVPTREGAREALHRGIADAHAKGIGVMGHKS